INEAPGAGSVLLHGELTRPAEQDPAAPVPHEGQNERRQCPDDGEAAAEPVHPLIPAEVLESSRAWINRYEWNHRIAHPTSSLYRCFVAVCPCEPDAFTCARRSSDRHLACGDSAAAWMTFAVAAH